MENRTLVVRVERHYGRTTVYPVCETAKVFAQVAGTKTLTTKALSLIKKLGYRIDIQATALSEVLDDTAS